MASDYNQKYFEGTRNLEGREEACDMETLLIEEGRGFDQTGRPVCCKYFMTVGEAQCGDELICETYGVRVVSDWETDCTVPNITTDPGKAAELVRLLARNLVTPVTLRDVIEDWLS